MAGQPESHPHSPETVTWARALWITYAIAGGMYLLSTSSAIPGRSTTSQLVISLGVLVATAPLVWATVRLLSSTVGGRALPIPVVYLLCVAATALGAVVSTGLARLLGYSEPVTVNLLLDVFVIGPIWIILIGSAVVLWQLDRTRRVELTASIDRIGRYADSTVDAANALEAVARREIAQGLVDISQSTASDRSMRDAAQWGVIAEQLRLLSTHIVRPLSHALMQVDQQPRRRRGPFAVVGRIVSEQDFAPLLVSAVFVAGAVSAHIDDYGWVRGLGLLIAEVGLIFAVMGSANVLMHRVRHRAWIFVATVALLQVIPLIPWPQLLGDTAPPSAGERIVASIASVVLILVTSGIGLIRARSRERLHVLEDAVAAAASQGSAESYRLTAVIREVASRLHGGVQAALVSSAFAIDNAVAEQRWDDARRALDRIEDLLMPRTEQVDSVTIEQAVNAVSQPWQAVGEIDCRIDERVGEVQGPCVEDVSRVVEEAVTNAFRHGGARRVRIDIASHGGDLRLRVIDDGRGVARPDESAWGLGLRTIDAISGGRWTLDGTTGHSIFEAVITPRMPLRS